MKRLRNSVRDWNTSVCVNEHEIKTDMLEDFGGVGLFELRQQIHPRLIFKNVHRPDHLILPLMRLLRKTEEGLI